MSQSGTPKKRTPKAKRYRAVYGHAKVGPTCRKIEKECGLPEGCLSMFRPNGSRAHRDGRISSLRENWAKESA